jgi:hypothetical protein
MYIQEVGHVKDVIENKGYIVIEKSESQGGVFKFVLMDKTGVKYPYETNKQEVINFVLTR